MKRTLSQLEMPLHRYIFLFIITLGLWHGIWYIRANETFKLSKTPAVLWIMVDVLAAFIYWNYEFGTSFKQIMCDSYRLIPVDALGLINLLSTITWAILVAQSFKILAQLNADTRKFSAVESLMTILLSSLYVQYRINRSLNSKHM